MKSLRSLGKFYLVFDGLHMDKAFVFFTANLALGLQQERADEVAHKGHSDANFGQSSLLEWPFNFL